MKSVNVTYRKVSKDTIGDGHPTGFHGTTVVGLLWSSITKKRLSFAIGSDYCAIVQTTKVISNYIQVGSSSTLFEANPSNDCKSPNPDCKSQGIFVIAFCDLWNFILNLIMITEAFDRKSTLTFAIGVATFAIVRRVGLSPSSARKKIAKQN